MAAATASAGRASSVYSRDDPFSKVLLPPETETPEERQARLAREAEAKRISDAIDEEIKADKERLKIKKKDIKLLLLGQSESGKSTLQKQFQLLYAPATLDSERASWRTVVYFNIAASLRRVLEALDAVDEDSDEPEPKSAGVDERESRPRAGSLSERKVSNEVDKQLATLRLRLGPLIATEETLAGRLTGADATPTYPPSSSGSTSPRSSKIYVRSGWQANAFKPRSASGRTSKLKRLMNGGSRPSQDSAGAAEADDMDEGLEDVARVLEASVADVGALWGHPRVKALVARRKLRLEEAAEYFLNNIQRIAMPGYLPTTDDIMLARIQTMGIVEHTFTVNFDNRPLRWHLYDVGGSRGQRHTWISYFDDATAIIFLAPISAFDQYLEEDPRTNRIDDSLQLFTMICSNQLLKKVHLVLFLNKTDVLRTKLEKGISVVRYITSFADRANEYDTVTSYFRAHFLQVHRKNNGDKRLLYTHLTSVVNTKATQAIILNVRDSVFRQHLEGAALV